MAKKKARKNEFWIYNKDEDDTGVRCVSLKEASEYIDCFINREDAEENIKVFEVKIINEYVFNPFLSIRKK